MSNLEALRTKRADIVSEMKAIVSQDSMTDEDVERYDKLEAEAASLDKQIERAENVGAREAKLEELEPSIGASHLGAPPISGGGHVRPAAPEAAREFSNFGEFIAAVWQRDKRHDPRLDQHWQDIHADQEMGTGSSGGFRIPTQFEDAFLRVDPAENVISGRCQVLPPGSPPDTEHVLTALDQTGSDPQHQYGGVDVEWIGEGQTKPKTEAAHRLVTMRPHEVAGHMLFTDKEARNAPQNAGLYQGLLSEALNGAVEDALYRGDGVAKPLGILNAPAARKVNRDDANAFGFGDVKAMLERCLYRGGQKYWLINQALMSDVVGMTNENNNLIYIGDSAVEGAPGTLMGYPVFWYEYAASKGSLGDVALVSTDPYYLLKQGSGPFLDVGYIDDDFVKNRRRLKIFRLVDGQPWLTEPFKLRNGHEVSPFVLLDEP